MREHTRNRVRKYVPLIILLVAFSLRMLVFQAMSNYPERFLQPDSHGYHRLAVNLIEHHHFFTAGDARPDVNRTPLYPAFLAIIYAFLGVSPSVAILVQIMIATLTVALAYRLGKLWLGTRTGALAALLLAIEAGNVIYANQLMTETLFSFIFLAGMLAWSVMVRRGQCRYGLLCGLLLGLGSLVRPVLFYFGPVAGLLTLSLYPQRWWRRCQAALSLVLVFALVVTPWMARNYSITGRAELSTIQAKNLVYYNLVQLRAFRQGISFSAARADLAQEIEREAGDVQDPGLLAGYYQQKALTEILAHPLEYLTVHIKGSLLFFAIPTVSTVARALGWVRTTRTGLLSNLMSRGLEDTWRAFWDFYHQLTHLGHDDWLFWGATGYEILFLALLNLSALWGAVKCIRTRRWDVLLFTVAIIGYFALVTGPVSYDARYRIPVIPSMALLAARGFTRPAVREI